MATKEFKFSLHLLKRSSQPLWKHELVSKGNAPHIRTGSNDTCSGS
jgi:hypothetical protein